MGTNFTRFKSTLLLLLLCLFSANTWADTYSHTIGAKTWSAYNTVTLSGIDWSATATGGDYFGYDATKGQQFGSGSKPATVLTLSTEGILGTITSVKIYTSGASSINAKVEVLVGGTSWGPAKAITSTNTAYGFTGSGNGTVTLNWTQTSAKAIYIKQIEIEYSTGTVITAPTFSPIAGTYFGPQEITLSADPGCEIYYTLDNTDPKEATATKYTTSFTISDNVTIKAVAKDGEGNFSRVVDSEYVIKKTTADLPYEIDFKSGFGDWILNDVSGTAEWSSDATNGANINGYSKGANEDWLISPAVTAENIKLTFDSWTQYAGDALTLLYSTNYNPNSPGDATWTDITDQAAWSASNSQVWTNSGNVLLTGLSSPVCFAFKYTCTASVAASWRIANLKIESSNTTVATPTFSVEDMEFSAPFDVTISCVTDGAAIYYTTNGQDPTNGSTPYDVAINISETTTLKAIAYKDGEASEVATVIYTKVLPAPTFEFASATATGFLNEEFTAPGLTNNSDGTVSYESSNLSVATVDNTGQVTILGFGSTTIKASVEATANFAAAEDSYLLTVIRKGEVTYTITTATSVEADVEIPGVTATFNNTYTSNKQQLTAGNSMTLTVSGYPYMVDHFILSMKTNSKAGAGTIDITVDGNEFFNDAYGNGYTGTFKDYEISGTAGLKGDIVVKITATENSLYCESFTIIPRIQTTVITPENVGTVTDLADNISLTGTWTAENMTTLVDKLNATITSVDMTGAVLDNVTTDIFVAKNPNCLKYFAANSTYPDWVNVIEGEDALEITLKDGYPFYNIKDFDAVQVSFERNFTHMLTEGWASLYLPFPVGSAELGDVYIEKYNRISPSDNTVYFDEATAVEANVPYIVRIKTGEVKTFTGSGLIPKTPEVDDTDGIKGTYTEIPKGEATGLYMLKADGSAFAVGTANASVPAFRAYIKYTSPSGARPLFSVEHDGGGTTGCKPALIDGEIYIYSVNGNVEINSTKAQVINIYALDGRIVKNMELIEGCNVVTDLAKGVYLLNNKKFIVK